MSAVASSVDKGKIHHHHLPGQSHDMGSTNVNKSIREPRKKPTSLWTYLAPPTPTNNNNTLNSNSPVLPTTSPSDRNAASIRIMVGDTQASVQHLADRVDKVLDLQRIEANKLEQVIGGVVQLVERALAAVAESNAAHTLKLAEALTRCARLEEALFAQSKAINELGAKYDCDAALSKTTSQSLDKTHAAVLSLAPLIKETQRAVDSSSRLLSAETKNWINEHGKDTGASLDKVREQVGGVRDAWDGSLALHRQETSVLFSAVLAGIRSLAGSTPVDDSYSTGPEPSRLGIVPAPVHILDTTAHAQLSSSGFVTASEASQVQHAAKNPNSSSWHTQPSPVHAGKNSTQPKDGVLVEETQSTALSSVPDQDLPGEPMAFERGRGFGALSKRAGSDFASFTNPGSPGFTIQRRPFVPGSAAPKQPDSSALQAGTPAPTIGHSSPNENASSLRSSLNKRAAWEDVPPGPTKRSRKNKTRVLMDSQELLMFDSSPER